MEGKANLFHTTSLKLYGDLRQWGVRCEVKREDKIWYEDSVSPLYDLLGENIRSNLIKSHNLPTPEI